MTVKVVSKGPVKTKEVICCKCGYNLAYTGEDVIEGVHTDYTGDSEVVYFIRCPRSGCGVQTIVSRWI